MNLPLHFGLLGSLEACGIALLVGMLSYAAWHWIARAAGLHNSAAIGWAIVCAIVAGAGIDAWKLFYMGVARLESPVYARLFLSTIHDPDSLGVRTTLEILGAMTGVVIAWLLFSGGMAGEDATTARADEP